MGARLGILAAAALALTPRVARASAQELYGVGPRDLALAGAATALGDHAGALYYDPAGLAAAPRVRFYAVWLQADAHLTIDGKTAPGVQPMRATSFGFVLPLPLRGPLENRLTLGLLLHSPNDKLIRVYSRPAQEPQFVILQNHAQVMGLFAGGALRLSPAVAIGAGTRLLANVGARVRVVGGERGVENTTTGFLTTTMAPMASVRVAPPGKPWRAALTWRHKLAQKFATPTSSDLYGFSAPTPGLEATTCFVPSELVAGGAWETPAWGFTVDLAGKRWSEFPDPTVGIGRIAPASAPFPRFHDTVAPRAGIEWTRPAPRATVVLRGGYGFEPTPVPAQHDDYSFYDDDRHVLGAGAGIAVPWRNGHLRVELGAQAHLLAVRRWHKDAGKVPAGTPLDHRTAGQTIAASAAMSFEY